MHVPMARKRFLCELCMLLCELADLSASIVIVRAGMLTFKTDARSSSARDAAAGPAARSAQAGSSGESPTVYAIMCGVTTAMAMATTLVSLIIPDSVWEAWEVGGVAHAVRTNSAGTLRNCSLSGFPTRH